MKIYILFLVGFLACCATQTSAQVSNITLVAAGSAWKYLDNGSDQGTALQAINFNDTGWASGRAQLGYGDGDEATVVSYGPNVNAKYITTYFRRAFVATDALSATGLTVRLLRDDGGVVYLNGVEVFRSNMGGSNNVVNYLTPAANSIPNSDESVFFSSAVNPALLRSGTNVIAVEIHQANGTSSDMSFDLQLVATLWAGPPVIVQQPRSQSVTPGGTVTFSVKAVGGAPLRYQWFFNDDPIADATNSILRGTDVAIDDAGTVSVAIENPYGSVNSAKVALTVVELTGDLFQITRLTTNHVVAAEHFQVTGDDRGGIAATFNDLFVTGDAATARFEISDLTGAASVQQVHDSLVSDLRTGRVYVLANGTTPTTFGSINALLEVDGTTGAITTNAITLSTNIGMNGCYGCMGVFSGFGRIVLHSGSRAYSVLLPSGVVQDLGPMATPQHQYSENWAYWGVAEFFNNAHWLVYVRDAQTIVRTRVPDGLTLTVGTFLNLSDMASFTVSPLLNRWYFHHQYNSQFRSGTETVGFADAAIAHEQQSQPPAILVAPRDRSVPAGSNATFTVLAVGHPLSYRWQFNGQDIIGGTNQTFVISGASAAQVGLYTVVVSNNLGSATSSPALLNVISGNKMVAKIAVYGADPMTYIDDVRQKILGTGLFDQVDAFEAWNGAPVPTLQQLQQYDAVLAFSDGSFTDPNSFGNALADYVDGGGGVVQATFAFSSGAIQGRWSSGSYSPFTSGFGNSGGPLTLVPDDPSHPLLDGVSSFNGGSSSYRNAGFTLATGADLVAHWSNGEPLVGVKPSGDAFVVGLNFFPPSSTMASVFWDAITDGAQLMANALIFAGRGGGNTVPGVPAAIRTPPKSVTALQGLDVSFGVRAYGSPALSFQWLFNAVPIGDATNRLLNLLNIQNNQSGAYAVIVSNAYGSVTSQVATLTVVPTRGVVGFFTDFNTASTGLVQSIVSAQFTPLRVADISTFDLSRLSVLLLNESSDHPSPQLRQRLPDIQEWVNNGGRLIIHQRSFNNEALAADPLLVGTRGVILTNVCCSADVNIGPGPTNLVVNGPHGTLTSASFDGGEQSYSAIAGAVTLPPGTASIFVAGSLTNQVVSFAYGLGAGLVYHSSLWLDWYLDYSTSQVGTLMRTVYVPNLIEFAATYTASGPPVILAPPENRTATTGSDASLFVSARGESPLRYQWLFNGAILSGATNNPLRLLNVSTNDAGAYSVIISNSLGSVTSSVAALKVVPRLSVGVFHDPRYVYTGLNTPADNVQAMLVQLGYTVRPFTNLMAALANDVLVFPPAGPRGFVQDLDNTTRSILQAYVSQGGLLILQGGYENANLLNSVFQLPLAVNGCYSGLELHRSSQANGTPFADAPLSIAGNYCLYLPNAGSLPATAVSLYTNEFYGPAVTFFPYGAGTLMYLAWSWDDAAPVGQQDGGWSSVLASAVQSKGVVSGWLSVAPLVAAGSVWRYLDTGSDQGTAWRSTNFNDSSWAFGPAQLGYGDGDEATVVGFGPDANNKFVTTYFRRSFIVTNVASVSSLTLRLLRDDGAAVYLNGVEIVRDCLSPGASFGSYALCTISDAAENQWLSYTISPSLVRTGTNLLAVEIHQINGTSTDISFDLELSAVVSATGPLIRTQPSGHTIPPGSTVTLNVVAEGALPLSYQWRLDDQNLPTATNAILILDSATANASGRYSVVVSNEFGTAISADASIKVVTLVGDTFRIANLSTNNALVVDDTPFAGDDRGGIAASADRLFYTGDGGTALFDAVDLTGGTNIGIVYDAMVSELGSERVYSLASGSDPADILTFNGGWLTTLLEIDGGTGELTGSSIQLSQSIDLTGRYGQVGIFAGLGRIVVHDGTRAWNIDVASGFVIELGTVPIAAHNYSENWAYWGVAEFFNGDVWLVYVQNSQTIVRTRVSDGLTQTVATFANLSDTASITVSVPFGRWYFHHQYNSQFSTFYDTTGFADAAFVSSAPAIAPSIVTPPRDQTIAASGTALLRVVARGTGPLRYQWLFEGSPVNGATNSALTLSPITTNQAGHYSVVVSNDLDSVLSSAGMLTVMSLGGETFKIANLSSNAVVVDDYTLAGYDRGAIAVSGQKAFYSGNSGTARFDLADLSGGTNAGVLIDGLISDLSTETVYALADGTNLFSINRGVITTLLVVDGLTGERTGASVTLSQPISLGNRFGQIGFFAGFGRIVVTDGAQAWTIETASGLVLSLGPMTVPQHNYTEVGAYWGVAEFFGGSLWLVYVRDSQTIVRTRVPDGLTESVTGFTYLSDMATITLSVPLNRWYFHHQYNSQFSSFYGTLGFAEAAFVSSAPLIAPGILQSPLSQSVGIGGTVAFKAVARGSAPLGYQWLFEDDVLPGATNNTLTLTNISIGQSGRYSIIVTNLVGSVTSAPALLRVVPSVTVALFSDPAFVYTNQSGQAESVRSSLRQLGHLVVSFTNVGQVTNGSAPLLFPALEAGDLAFALSPSVRPALQGFVGRGGTLIVQGTVNDASRPARLLNAVFGFNLLSDSVSAPSFRTAQAVGTAFADDPVTISANYATLGLSSSFLPMGARSIYAAPNDRTTVALIPFGSGRIIYLGWNWNNAAPLGPLDGGWLTVLESAVEETVTPAGRAPEILIQPQGRTTVAGTTVRMQVAAAGSPFTYQWMFNGQPLSGATNYVLPLTAVATNQSGAYSVVVSNAFGVATSSVALLVVVPPVTVGVFDDPRFVNTSGGIYAASDNLQASLIQLGYRVQPFTNISSATTNQVLVFPIFDQGDFLSSLDAPNRVALQSFVQQGGLIICHGYYNNVYFLNSVFGLSLSSYGFSGGQFLQTPQAQGTPIASSPALLPYNSDTFSLYSSSLPSFGARNVYSGLNADYLSAVAQIQYGSGNIIYLGWNWMNALPSGSQDGGWVETLGNAVLTGVDRAAAAPIITLQPQSKEVLAGTDTTFSIGGYGSQPVQLQWYFNGQPLAGATNITLSLSYINTNQSGGYFIVLRNVAGSATSHVAQLTVRPTRGSVGYYTDYNPYDTGLAAPIIQAGFTPLQIFDITTNDLSRLDMLMIDEIGGSLPSLALLSRLPAIETWVNEGGKLIVHDRSVTPAVGQPNPFLFGSTTTVLTNSADENVQVLPPGNSLVTSGPHGVLNNTSLDSGGSSYHGYALRETLPPRALPILGAGLNTNNVVAFSYGLGAGSVYYAAMPLDYFLQACCADVWTRFRTVYAPNVIEHVAAFTVEGPPAFLAELHDTGALAGGTALLKISANGSGPLFYQWFFNGAPILDATNATLAFSNVTTNQAGRYSVVLSNALGTVTSAVAVLTVVQPTPFRIVSLTTNGSVIVDHNNITGDDRGGIGVSATHVYYTGDSASGRFSATNLTGGEALPRLYDALVSDLRTEKLYHLANGTNLIAGPGGGTNSPGAGGSVTALIELDGSTGALTTNRVELSVAIPLGADTGIFAAYGAVVLHTGGRVYRIELPSGLVLDLGPLASFLHASCETWAYWGVAEFFGGSVHLVYVQDPQTIARTSVRDGVTTNLSTFSYLGDMCSLSVSTPRARWYFHHQGNAQFGGVSETLGYASATFDRPPRFLTTLTNVVMNEDSTTGPIPFTIADAETLASLLVVAVDSSNPILLPVTNISFGGTVQVRTIALTPAPDQFGTSVVTLTIIDGIGLSTNRSFTVTVNPVNDPPIAQHHDYVTEEDVPLVIAAPGVLVNASDVDPDTILTAVVISFPTNGALVLNANGSFLYTPATNFHGTDFFTYTATDGAATSAIATVNINITPANDAPVAQNDSYVTDEDVPLIVAGPGVLTNDSDIEGNLLTAHLVTAPAHGTVSLNTNGSFTYLPAKEYNGPDSFTYRANDSFADSGIAIVFLTINAVNDAPVLAPIKPKEAVEGVLLAFTASATDIEVPAEQTLIYTLENAPAGATINSASGDFAWTPTASQVGTTNEVTIRVTDNGAPPLNDSKVVTIICYAMPLVSIADVSVPGGSSGTLVAEFEVTLSAPSTRPVWVDFATTNGTATADSDYAATNGMLFFPPNVTNQVIKIIVTGNPDYHADRDFFINLANVTNAVLSDNQARGVILDEPASGVMIEDVIVVEGTHTKTNASFPVSLSVVSDRLITVRYAVSNGTATIGKDFRNKKGTISFEPGVTNQTVLIPIVGDALNEDDETFRLYLSAPLNAVIKTEFATGTILDDDPLPSLSVVNVTSLEQNPNPRAVTFLAWLSAKSGRTVSVNFSTADGSALAGENYMATNGTIVFPPGNRWQRLNVRVLGGTINHGNKTFFLNLTNPVNANLNDAQAVGRMRINGK